MKSITYRKFHISFLLSVPAVSRRHFAFRSQLPNPNCCGYSTRLVQAPTKFELAIIQCRPRAYDRFKTAADVHSRFRSPTGVIFALGWMSAQFQINLREQRRHPMNCA